MIIYNDKLKEKVEKLKKRNSLEEIILNLEKIHKQDEKTLNHLKELKKTLAELKYRVPDDSHKKFLAEIIVEEEPAFGSNTLILAPVGSGKTTLIKDVLIDTSNINSTLMLVSNRFLKDSIYEKGLREEKRGEEKVKVKVTKDKEKKDSMYIMTYHEFGLKIKDNNEFMDEINQVFCDEVHSLPEYREYGQGSPEISFALEHAMKYLFSKQKGKQIFYFTATDNSFNELKRKRPDLVKNVKVIDYRNHSDIRKYMELSKSYITHIEQIRPYLKDRIESFNYFKSKGLAFARAISSLKRIESILIDEGYNPLVLWSDVNEEHKLSEEQIKARDELIKTNKIPDGYNFLVMNSSMREGWDLKDPNVRLIIMNTTNETDVIQARGRLRQDIDLIVYRTSNELEALNSIKLSEKYINKPLTTEDKSRLCEDLNVKDINNRVRKWASIKQLLINSGYEIKDSKITIDGKRRVVSTISIEKGVYGAYSKSTEENT